MIFLKTLVPTKENKTEQQQQKKQVKHAHKTYDLTNYKSTQ